MMPPHSGDCRFGSRTGGGGEAVSVILAKGVLVNRAKTSDEKAPAFV